MAERFEHFATLLDSGFLPQGLALLASLERHCSCPFLLHVLCMDEEAEMVLTRLASPKVRPIPLRQIMTEQMDAIWNQRNRAEQCWTSTPALMQHLLESEGIDRVTYVDADLWFWRNPLLLLAGFEESGRAVQITLHGYHPTYDISPLTGRFCVQFLTATRVGVNIMDAWRLDCLEWCFAKFEPNRFGDQKYLDRWEERFPDQIHVHHEPGHIQAPWNYERFPISEAVAFHFHGLRLLSKDRVLAFRGYSIPRSVQTELYPAYLRDLTSAIGLLRTQGFTPQPQAKRPSLLETVGVLIRKLQRALDAARPYRIMDLPTNGDTI